jgi:Flp pilus assembly protein TadD
LLRFQPQISLLLIATLLNGPRPSLPKLKVSMPIGQKHTQRSEIFMRAADAETEYKTALRLSPQFAPAAVNLADFYRQQGRDGEGESILRSSIAEIPNDAGLHHALGLILIRLNRSDEALPELRQAAKLEPVHARYAYVYAVALHSAGRNDEAMDVLRNGLKKHPHNRDVLLALITFSRDEGDLHSALEYSEQLAKITPNDHDLANFVDDLRHQIEKPH